jgi:hypothetical protein
MLNLIKQSSTGTALIFELVSSSDGATPITGAASTVTVKISKNAASGITPSGAISEIDSTNLPGLYAVAGNATDTNTLGSLIVYATLSGALNARSFYEVVAFDPTSATNLGLSGLPTANPGASGGIAVPGSQMSLAPIVSGTASAGSATTLTLQSGQTYATNILRGNRLDLIGTGTGANQSAVILSNTNANPSVITFDQLAVAPDSTTQYSIQHAHEPALNAALQVSASNAGGGGGTGNGTVAVNHNTPTIDAMRFANGIASNPTGVFGATINAYVQTDYAAGNIGLSNVKGQTATDVNGRWVAPLLLSISTSYVLVAIGGIPAANSETVTISIDAGGNVSIIGTT